MAGAAVTRPWHELPLGTVVRGPSIEVTEELADELIRRGGYVHPLFTDPEFLRTKSPFASRPLPGAAVLYLMGGLAERCGVLDDTVLALLGFRDVEFVSPAVVGDTLTLELSIVDCIATSRKGRGELVLRWRALRSDESLVAEATARMLVVMS